MRSRVATKCRSAWSPYFGWVALALSLVGVLAGSLAPSSVLGWLRTVVPGFAPAWDWLDASLPGFNPLHAIAYLWLALLWKLWVPRGSRWRMPLALAVLGAAAEALQNFVPGRQPRVTDWLSDLVGIALGWGVAWMVNRAARRLE